ncbi:MAG: class I SAM-dependent methyltransferase [Rhabdochlamydiaceae bacterium]|nr:class I SAM-dependent methyltransferase [Candidatus Amphrikana amoebophyrae]
MDNDYELIDSGNEKKLERFGPHIMERPCFQAIWQPSKNEKVWNKAQYIFSREGRNLWKKRGNDDVWEIDFEGMKLKLSPTDFGHLGLFPEHKMLWKWMQTQIGKLTGEVNVLNLFAYTGCATLAAAQKGAKVCHVDASKKSVAWAKENAALNGLEKHPIRWIVDDALKFMKREAKRENHYEGIILDPPSFGRGAQGQLFKIEEHLMEMLSVAADLLKKKGKFLILSCHTPGISPLVLKRVVEQIWPGKKLSSGEMIVDGENELPCGSYVRWSVC